MRPLSKFKSSRMIVALMALCVVLVSQGCGGFRLLNRDKTVLGAHPVMITPCGWKLENKFGGPVKDEQSGKIYQKHSCGETIVTIKDEELAVNGKSYGKFAKETDSIKVDGGRVFVNGKEVQAVTDTAFAESGR
ncbi:MAG: hypothetical protein H0U54_03835 [Acidobacteria bacterium]|nr:hypothetical protein [Acidobacteriota bacterium]